MAWIKRNLFFVIGGVIALALLGGAGYYDFQSWTQNSEELAKLNDIYSQLKDFSSKNPSPSPENIELARKQETQMRDWITQARTHFQPIPSIPDATVQVDSELLGATLRNTVVKLQDEAVAANVTIPPKYCFSFESEAGTRQMIMKYAPASIAMLPVQLGEIKAISDVIFGAHVNALDAIQRVRVSDDDLNGPATDYIDESIVTNDTAVITPYMVTFRCFSPELAAVISGFASSPNGFVVTSVSVQPASGTTEGGYPGAGQYPGNFGGYPGRFGGRFAGRGGFPGGYPPNQVPGAPEQVQNVATPNGLPIVLKEQLLRVTLEVKIVKLLTK